MNPELLSELRAQLERDRDRLIDESRLLVSEARDTNVDTAKNSPAEVGSESFTRDTEFAHASLEQSQLSEILAALQRMDDGSYGTCELTGQSIPEERLRAVPWTRFSIEGQRVAEDEDAPTARSGRIVGDIDPLQDPPRFAGSPSGAETQSGG